MARQVSMHPMFKNWNPRNQAQVDNTLRLVAAEYPSDFDEVAAIARSKGFKVPDSVAPARGWGDFS